MTTTTIKQPIQVITEGKHTFQIFERAGENKFPHHPYSVLIRIATPKSKMLPYKTESHYVYKTLEEAHGAIDKRIEELKRAEVWKAERREIIKARNAGANASEFFKEGDIVVNSWGWEQTNVFFYKVVKVGKKTIEVKEITQEVEKNSEGYMGCRVWPGDSFLSDGDGYTLRVKTGGRLSNPENYYHMIKWDGRSMYKSWYA